MLLVELRSRGVNNPPNHSHTPWGDNKVMKYRFVWLIWSFLLIGCDSQDDISLEGTWVGSWKIPIGELQFDLRILDNNSTLSGEAILTQINPETGLRDVFSIEGTRWGSEVVIELVRDSDLIWSLEFRYANDILTGVGSTERLMLARQS